MNMYVNVYFLGGRYQTESGGLRISNITQADDGIYVCRAEVEADGRLKDRRIEVTVHSEYY